MINRFSASVALAGLLAATAAMGAPRPAEAGGSNAGEAHGPGIGAIAPLSQEDLAAVSAGQSPVAIALTNQNLTAVNSGNLVTAQSIATGQVSFANGAFQGFTGIGNFVINTGNNNNLQGSLSVTVIPLQ